MRILVPNLGSTSLKYQLIETEGEKVLARGKIERIGSAESPITTWDAAREREVKEVVRVPDHRAAIKILLDMLAHLGTRTEEKDAISAVGFKAVHGGPRYCGSFLIDDDLLAAMEEFVPVAPVHNPVYIQAMQIFREVLPGVPMVAVFETGFHASMPERAYTYGVPHEWQEKHGVRRYGFHGSSHRYVARRVPRDPRTACIRAAACFLPPGWKFFDLRDAGGEIRGHELRLFSPVRNRARHALRRS